jgi:hypothetical protein
VAAFLADARLPVPTMSRAIRSTVLANVIGRVNVLRDVSGER